MLKTAALLKVISAGMRKEGLSDLNTHIFKTFGNNNFQVLTPV